jgi:hypothetical protein
MASPRLKTQCALSLSKGKDRTLRRAQRAYKTPDDSDRSRHASKNDLENKEPVKEVKGESGR